MSRDCTDFRARLTAALEAGPAGPSLTHGGRPLQWHEHLFACAACRELLAGEEALEVLLTSLPEPRLPLALAQRVLRRLADPERALDDLLDTGDSAAVPAGLTDRVLAGLATARTDADPLDRLLDHLPEPEVPTGLADGVLEAARLEKLLDQLPEPRTPVGLAPRVLARTSGERPAARGRRPILHWLAPAAAAAVLLLVAGKFLVSPDPVDPAGPGEEHIVVGPEAPGAPGDGDLVATHDTDQPTDQPEPELLDSLDLLEDWDLLMAEDVDLLLGSLDEVDQELLLFAALDEEQG